MILEPTDDEDSPAPVPRAPSPAYRPPYPDKVALIVAGGETFDDFERIASTLQSRFW